MQSVKIYNWMYKLRNKGRKLTLPQIVTCAVIYNDTEDDGIYKKGIDHILNMTRVSINKQIKILKILEKAKIIELVEEPYNYCFIKGDPISETLRRI